MAVFRAFQATDMRSPLAAGIPVTVNGSEVVVEGATTTTTFEGRFFLPYSSSGLLTVPAVFDPGFDVLFRPGTRGFDGTIASYGQDRLGVPRFEVTGLDLDAFRGFFALFALDDTDLFQSLAFAGDDVFLGSRSRDVLIGYGGDDSMWGYGGNDRLSGGAGSDRLYGVAGRDALSGGSGRDWLWGGSGADSLAGGTGRDYLDGGSGDDTLTGGRDQDRLTGRGGDDCFRFLSTADSKPGGNFRDRITDFTPGDDTINLRRIDANEAASGNQAFVFIGDREFTDRPGQLRFDPDNRLVQGDTDGDGRADLEIKVSGSFDLDAGDFVL